MSHQFRGGSRSHGDNAGERGTQKIKGWDSCRSILHLGDGHTKESQKRESENGGRKLS